MEIRTINSRNRNVFLIIIALGFLIWIAMTMTKFNFEKGIIAVPNAFVWMAERFIPNGEAFEKFPEILKKLIETILLSISATTVAGGVALFFGIMGSKVSKSNGILKGVARFIASVSRNIPDAVWAMIFLLSFGQNILTGYFALFFGSFGILTRAFIEAMDESSEEVVEALEATGASYFQIIFQGIIPSTISQIITWILYMIETNIRSATLIGILTGTGIGFVFDIYYKGMNYPVASLVILTIIITVFIIEFVSNKIRRVIL
ncbi:MAG: PhnE/PtxC family ABC transporter permease [Clostridium sp.]